MISNNQGYHQSQSLRRCGLHAVNNLLQKEAYTTSDFTAISNELSQISHQSHESILTLGNYDYNILERALSLKGYSLKWHDNRQPIDAELLKSPQLFGFLLNLTKPAGFLEKLCNWDPKHWVAMPKLSDEFKYIDSKEVEPKTYKDEEAYHKLEQLRTSDNGNVIIYITYK